MSVSEASVPELEGEFGLAHFRDLPAESGFARSPWTAEARDAYVRRWEAERDQVVAELKSRAKTWCGCREP